MDLEDQGVIKDTVEEHGKENVIVVLGSPDAESAEIYAETVTTGDPTFAGPLAGVSLGLPVYHILEDEVKEHIDQAVYEQQIGMMEMVLDKEAISKSMRRYAKVNLLHREAADNLDSRLPAASLLIELVKGAVTARAFD
jgi:glycine/sarcosine/betaine reductase complex component A